MLVFFIKAQFPWGKTGDDIFRKEARSKYKGS
jgi:hypothetical protein